MISTFNEKTLAFKSYREASVLMIACRFRKYPGKQTHSVILVCAAALLEKKLKSRMYWKQWKLFIKEAELIHNTWELGQAAKFYIY